MMTVSKVKTLIEEKGFTKSKANRITGISTLSEYWLKKHGSTEFPEKLEGKLKKLENATPASAKEREENERYKKAGEKAAASRKGNQPVVQRARAHAVRRARVSAQVSRASVTSFSDGTKLIQHLDVFFKTMAEAERRASIIIEALGDLTEKKEELQKKSQQVKEAISALVSSDNEGTRSVLN